MLERACPRMCDAYGSVSTTARALFVGSRKNATRVFSLVEHPAVPRFRVDDARALESEDVFGVNFLPKFG